MAKSVHANSPMPHTGITPQFDRVNYFYGQMLGVRDFQAEQQFFREKIKLHNRCLHGHGVVCGLKITCDRDRTPAPHPVAGPPTVPTLCLPRIGIEPGFALDSEGNELVVREPIHVDLWHAMDDPSRQMIKAGSPVTLYISLHYHEVQLEPTRPVLTESCGGVGACYHGKTRDGVCVVVSTQKPREDDRCETCCTTTEYVGECLATVTIADPADQKSKVEVNNSVRRPVSTYRSTRVAKINWVHGGHYGPHEADSLLEKGLRIKFTRPINEHTIKQGILDVFHLSTCCEVKHLHGWVHADFPIEGEVTTYSGVRYKFDEPQHKRLSPGDRLVVVLRSAFVLDYCCQPIDGTNVGGWVPVLLSEGEGGVLPASDEPGHPPQLCAELRGTYGAWTSGNNAPGMNFESWIFVKDAKGGYKS